jgi:hypothetical protein
MKSGPCTETFNDLLCLKGNLTRGRQRFLVESLRCLKMFLISHTVFEAISNLLALILIILERFWMLFKCDTENLSL